MNMNYGTSNKYIMYSVNSTEHGVSIPSNGSYVNVWMDVWRTNTGYTTYGSGTAYLRINGTLYSATITSSQKITSSAIRLITVNNVWIPHNADGSKAISITGWISHDRFSSSEQGYTHTLTTIPRQASISSFTCASSYLNGAMTIKYNSKTSYTYYLRLSVPNVQQIYRGSLGTKAAGDQTATHTFTSAELQTIYNLFPNTDKVTIEAVIETYNGSTKIGESGKLTLTLTMPTSVVPSFTSVTAMGVNLFGNFYLQSISSVKLTINGASGIYGSTIKSYSIKGDTFSYNGSSSAYTTGVLVHSGNITFTATITDSRGRTASKTVTITVTAYSPPTISLSAYRCNSSGVEDAASGTYIAVVVKYSYSAVTGNSIASKSLQINGTSKSTTFASGTKYVFGTYSISSVHTVKASVTDAVGKTTGYVQVEVPVATVGWDIVKDQNGKIVSVAFGRMFDKNLLNSFLLAFKLYLDNANVGVKVGSTYKDIDLSKVLIVTDANGNAVDLQGRKWVVLGTTNTY